jgi:hypothetical protein
MKSAVAMAILFCGVAAYGQDLAGQYVLRGEMEVGSELALKKDGHFEFMLAYGAADYWAKGTWRQDGNAVVLQSAGKKEEAFKLVRSEAGSPGRIRVWVIGQNGKGVEHIKVHLLTSGESLEATTTEDGAAVFPDEASAKAVEFEIRVYQIEAGPFPLKAPDKDYYFELNGDAVQQVLFENERLAIDGKTLLMTHWGQDHPMHYEKE